MCWRPAGRRGGGRRRRRAAARQDRTITFGNRMATTSSRPRVPIEELADAAQLASLADETPEGRSIVTLAKEKFICAARCRRRALHLCPFTAQTRMSGVDLATARRPGTRHPQGRGRVGAQTRAGPRRPGGPGRPGGGGRDFAPGRHPARRGRRGARLAYLPEGRSQGRHPRAVCALRRMGVKTVIDHPATTSWTAGHRGRAGVDDFIAEAKRRTISPDSPGEEGGKLIAMIGTAPTTRRRWRRPTSESAIEHGTQAAREAGTWSISTAIRPN